MTNPIQHFKYPSHAYNNLLGGIRKINNAVALELNANLKAGRNQRVIQRIDKELNKRERNTVLSKYLDSLKDDIINFNSQNLSRVRNVRTITQNIKRLKSLKTDQAKLIPNKKLRRNLKQSYNSQIQGLAEQLQHIDHKKHNKRAKNENLEIPNRFANLQFGGANGNKIQRVASTTRKVMSHYELEFHSENYHFDYAENRMNALIHLLNKSIPERVQFYQQQLALSLADHHHGIKIAERAICLFEKVGVEEERKIAFDVPKDDSKYSKMLQHTFLRSSDIQHTLQQTTHTFCDAVAESEMNESGYVYYCILRMLIDVYMYNAPSGSNYIELPKEIEKRKSTINIKNNDNQCFKYCLYCHFEKNNLPFEYQNRKRINEPNKNITRNPSRVSNYDKLTYLDFTDIPFPVPIEENIISKIEDQNNVSINIYSLDKDENENYHFAPEHLTKSFSQNENHHINLLYLTDNEKGHCVYITKYDNLCKKANSNSTVYVCRKCCWVFYHQKELDEHYEKDDCRSVALNFVPVDKKYIQFEIITSNDT